VRPGAGSSATLAAPALGSGAMFDRIAERYDLLNRILSLGVDQRWRREAVRALDLPPGARVLDVATGTADLAAEIARTIPEVTVVGVDPSARMLSVGAAKVERAGLAHRVALTTGDAEHLPFDSASFDAAAMAFGIRNVPDRARALREIARVVRPGGRIAILELCEPGQGAWGSLSRLYVHEIVPRVGAFLSGATEYRYLQASIARFPSPAEFGELMRASGILNVTVRAFTFGACALFVGTAPERG
jgi:demethylmenaquinone methyltransferase/2-methoxy-6-polyprenyl-1,4-benzoquinol methylase